MNSELKSNMKSLFQFKLSNMKEMSIKQRFQGYPIVSIDEEGLGEGPIFYQGWEKYFVILGKAKNNEKRFLVNGEYDIERNHTKKHELKTNNKNDYNQYNC